MRRLINLLILLFSFLFLILGILQFSESLSSINSLDKNFGTVKNIYLKNSVKKNTNKELIINLEQDPREYTITTHVDYLSKSLQNGDSVCLYTKSKISFLGHFVSSETGARVWTTHNPNQVYHMTKGNSKEVLIDFEQHKRNLRKMVWIFPLASFLFFLWFLYRKSGKKHPLIVERSS